MVKLKYFIAEVFVEKNCEGNPVVILMSDKHITKRDMYKIALDTGKKEVIFIKTSKTDEKKFTLNIFTPRSEIPFSTHPVLGASYVIKNFLAPKNSEKITLDLQSGKIPFNLHTLNNNDSVWLEHMEPEFDGYFDKETILPIISLKPSDINENYPIQKVGAGGLPYYFIPVNNKKALQKVKIDLKRYYEFILKLRENKYGILPSAFYVFAPETTKSGSLNLSARAFDHYYEIPEDPASGSAGGCLVAYLLKYKFSNRRELKLKVEQGRSIHRPSLIRSSGSISGSGKFEIKVGGKVNLLSRGEMFHEK